MALDEFRKLHGGYPQAISILKFARSPGEVARAGGREVLTIDPGSTTSAGLTTPVPYLTSLWADPTAPWPEREVPYAYWSDGKSYVVYAAGPDRRYDLVPARQLAATTGSEELSRLITRYSYDPTNGYFSGGDLCRYNIMGARRLAADLIHLPGKPAGVSNCI